MTAATAATDRIRRNTACTGCRDSKVKCNASQSDNHAPCSRCTKLGISCVVDKSHKRSTRRSKLEQLEKELKSIKDVVKTSMSDCSFRPPPEASPSLFPPTDARPPAPSFLSSALRETLAQMPAPAPALAPLEVPDPATSGLESTGSAAAGVAPAEAAAASARSTAPLMSETKKKPAGCARALGNHVFTRADIDHYFDKYFEHFHPYFPVLRSRNPDKTYSDSPLLFWSVIYVVSRRYARSAGTFGFLVEALPHEIWPVLCSHALPMASINALLLLSAWAQPTARLLVDPALTYASVAVSASMVVGLHTMKGAHSHFCFGPRKMEASDEEAAYSWAGCNVVAQRVSSVNGCPPNLALFNHALKATKQLDDSPYFKNLLTAQAICNRVGKTMFALLEQSNTVAEATIQLFETELDSEGALWASGNSKFPLKDYPRAALDRHEARLTRHQDLDTFTLLCTRLEIQAYYFVAKSDPESPTLRHNMLRAYRTATSLIDLAVKLEESVQFLHHAPSHIFRYILEASCLVMRVCMSTNLSSLLPGTGTGTGNISPAAAISSINTCTRALRACSVQDNDMPIRTLKIMESFWSLQAVMPSFGPVSELHHRIGSSLTFDSLRRWKVLLEGLQRESRESRGRVGLPKSADEQAVVAAMARADLPRGSAAALQTSMLGGVPGGVGAGAGEAAHPRSSNQPGGAGSGQLAAQSPGYGPLSYAGLGGVMPAFGPAASAEQLQEIDWDALMRDLDWGDIAEPEFPVIP
ncbi:uncharacterized protein BROUX77_002995 [Berkeleyomyces rouxiae]|uniref:uncharacterized protein n=1 Tax=Berkeleyomyces rouxiae TaxID=2035830 RepID=UPI003B7BCC9A